MKVLSFIPACTDIIYQLGLEQYLHGVTFECPSDKPKVVRSILEGNHFSSAEIENIVVQSKAQGKSLYYVDEDLLQQISPDIIFTQDVCEVCQIDTAYVQRAIYKLKKTPLIVPLLPKNLEEACNTIVTIAKTMGKEENAYRLLASLKRRSDEVLDTLRANKASLRRVMFMEWLNPIYNCGHWIPDQIAQAGGIDMLSNPSGYSVKIEWDKILQYNPEVIIVSPCGIEIERAEKEIFHLFDLPNWNELKAVKNDAVYLVDSNLFTCPSTKLFDGIELLASLFHPFLFERFQQKHAQSFKKISAKVIA